MGKNKERWAANRTRLMTYLATHPCIDCGEADIVVLDLDHVRGRKHRNVTRMLDYSWAAIEKEIAKCEVRCANCHRRKTAKQLGHFRSSLQHPAAWDSVSEAEEEGSTPSAASKKNDQSSLLSDNLTGP